MSTMQRAERRRSWFTAGIAGMASYIDAGAIVTTGTALVLYREAWGFGDWQFGQLSALLTVMIGLGAVVGGWMADRLGRRRTFTVTIGLYVLGAAVLVLAPGVEWLYVGIVLIGFGAGADLPPSLAMIAEAAPEGDEGKMITFSHVLWMVAIPVVNVFGILVGDMGEVGARIMYAHLMIVAAVVLLLRWRLPESGVWKKQIVAVEAGTIDRASLKGLFNSRYLFALLGVALFYSLTNIAANTNGQFAVFLYTEVAGTSVATASAMNLIGLGLSLLATFFLMGIVDTRFRMLGFALGTAAAVVAWMMPPLLGVTAVSLVIMGAIYGMAGIVSGEPMFKVWSQEVFPTEYRGTAQGIGIALTRAVAAGAALFTPAIVAYDTYLLFYFVAAVILLAGLTGFFWVARMPKVLHGEKVQGPQSAAEAKDNAPVKTTGERADPLNR